MWSENDPDDILKNIINIINSRKEKTAEVSIKIYIGGKDNTLEVVPIKYSLTMNPKSLIFFWDQGRSFEKRDDGPLTASGCIRLDEYSKVLNEYQRCQNTKNKKISLYHNVMSLMFNLLNYVSCENILHYSYC